MPSLGVLGLLGWLVIRLALQSGSDRRAYQDLLTAEREHHTRQLAQVRAELQAELAEVRGRVDGARQAQWAAEDEVARLRRKLAGHHPGGHDG